MDSKRLYRSRENRMLCGVCGCLGEFFGLDATIVRLLVAILAVSSIGTGVLIYFIAAFVIPEAE